MTDDVRIEPAGGRETYRLVAPEGQALFEAWSAMHGGRMLEHNGQVVESPDIDSLRWTGDRAGEPMTAADRATLTARLREAYARGHRPFELRLPDGRVEDETGTVRPGFRMGFPHVEHSDGWSLVDEFLSPAHPSAAGYPPHVEYAEPGGQARLRRRMGVSGGVRRRVLLARSLAWIGTRAGSAVTPADAERILGRVRAAYEHWGLAFIVDETTGD